MVFSMDLPGKNSYMSGASEIFTGLDKTCLRRLRWYHAHRGFNSSCLDHGDGTDIKLIGHKLIERGGWKEFQVTQLGMEVLSMAQQAEIERRKPHHEFASRLAVYLQSKDRLTWENIELRSSSGAYCRPDVFSVVKTLNEQKMVPQVHEVKVSRADFLSDMRKPEKWQPYQDIACGLVFACPKGIVEKHEVPEGCGLIIEELDGNWKILKRAKKTPVKINSNNWMKLVLSLTN